MAVASYQAVPNPELNFKLHNTASANDGTPSVSNKARSGVLQLKYEERAKRPTRSIATPAVIAYTKKGAIPHLTRDSVALLPNEMVSISLEHFLDVQPPPMTQAPMNLHRYIGLYETANFQSPIILLGLRDPSNFHVTAPTQDNLLLTSNGRGTTHKVTPSNAIEYLSARGAELIIAPSDEPKGELSSKKLEKVIKRGLQWASDILEKTEGRRNVFVPLVGSQSTQARTEFSEALLGKCESRATLAAKREPGQATIDSSITGYVLQFESTLESTSSPSELALASLYPLPENKPRIAMGVSGPHQILRTIREVGLDLFVDEWSTYLSTVGAALDFCFPAPTNESEIPPTSPSAAQSGGKIPIGHDLFKAAFDRAFVPLSRSPLALSASDPNPFGPIPPTRAYVHHLLQAREMTSYVILAQHNLIVMDRFFHSIRTVLTKHGQEVFEKEVERFLDYYQDQEVQDARGRGYDFVVEATKEWARVNKERGKGSLRDKLAKDNELLDAAGVSAPVVTSVVE